MPEITSAPNYVTFYRQHGVDLTRGSQDSQGIGDCPNCGKEEKFHVTVATGQFSCKSCQYGGPKGGGNAYTFLQHLHKGSKFPVAEGEKLRKDRKFLSIKTLEAWGVVQSMTTREWIVPGYTAEGAIGNLYRYVRNRQTGKDTLYSSATMHAQLFGVPLYDPKKQEVWICEGPWDGMALWECLQIAKRAPSSSSSISLTGTPGLSMEKQISVLAVPGAGTWNDTQGTGWAKLFEGKKVVLLYDNDHPRINQGKEVDGAGLAGVKRTASILMNRETPPTSIQYVRWGEETQHNLTLPTRYDVRDCLTEKDEKEDRVKALGKLISIFKDVPDEWVTGKSIRAHGGVKELKPVKCESWKTLQAAWKEAMTWHEGMDRAFSIMLATAMSTLLPEDQLWMKIIGPPSCGKTKLADALLVCGEFTRLVSITTGFYSGYKTDKAGKEDHSLIHKVRGKTLITKDGDTLIKNPNRESIMSELRDIFDGTSSKEFKTGITRGGNGLWASYLLLGTETLRELDESDAGQRFLDCVIMDGIPPEIEKAVMNGMFRKMLTTRGQEKNAEAESQDSAVVTRAKQLTGGYLQYLRRNAKQLTSPSKVEFSSDLGGTFEYMAKFVAYMRARPSDQQQEYVQREMGGRIQNQLCKLAYCLAAVMQRDHVDGEVMRRVKKTALDTARGNTLKIVDKIAELAMDEGLDEKSITIATGVKAKLVSELLVYMRALNVLEIYQPEGQDGRIQRGARSRYRMTAEFRPIYYSVRGMKK